MQVLSGVLKRKLTIDFSCVRGKVIFIASSPTDVHTEVEKSNKITEIDRKFTPLSQFIIVK